MTTHQITIVKESFEKLKPIAQQAGELFYKNLFAAAPEARHMFKGDINQQAGKLMYTLSYVVSHLHKLDTIISDVQKLAVRHNQYGAQPAHYDLVGSTLLVTLEQGLGEGWNEELKEAWATAYGILADAMIAAQMETQVTTSVAA